MCAFSVSFFCTSQAILLSSGIILEPAEGRVGLQGLAVGGTLWGWERVPQSAGLRWKNMRAASLCLGSIMTTDQVSWLQLLPFWQVTPDVPSASMSPQQFQLECFWMHLVLLRL